MKLMLVTIATVAASAIVLMNGGWRQGTANAANYASVSAGGQHACALTSAAGVMCWGRNAEGELGDGSLTQQTRPVGVSGLSSGVSKLSAGERHSCVVVTGGTGKCWGYNYYGVVGDGTAANRATPVVVCASGSGAGCPALSGIASISSGGSHTCAVTSTGGVKCWGWNRYGQLGNGTTTDSSLPVDVTGLTSGVTAVAAGQDHNCALLTSGGVKCWGWNQYGDLGNTSCFCYYSSTPIDVTGLSSGVAAIDLGAVHSCALMATQTVKCWGSGGSGALGNNTTTSSTAPVTVCAPGAPTDPCGSLSSVLMISAGGGHTCAYVGSAGTYCWGWDGFGQLGDGSGSLEQFTKRATQVAGLSYLLSISAGTGSTCVVFDPTGAVNCWGWNSDGQLGNGTTANTATWQASAADWDRDGCADYRELQTATGSESTGGKRNPKNFWDFFDTPNASNVRDRVVTSGGSGDASDVSRVQARYGSSGNPNIDPLSAPPPTGYHPAFDRTYVGPNNWNLGPPNGTITIQDVVYVSQQVGHNCQ